MKKSHLELFLGVLNIILATANGVMLCMQWDQVVGKIGVQGFYNEAGLYFIFTLIVIPTCFAIGLWIVTGCIRKRQSVET